MAKGSKTKSGTRDDVSSLTVSLRSRVAPTNLRLVEDLRTFDPAPAVRPARLFSGVTAAISATSVAPKSKKARGRVPYQIAFTAPGETLVCVRRQRRKEVLFAKRKTGKGGQRKARWSKWSSTKC